MIASAQLTQSYFDFKRGITALVVLPSEFIGGKMMILRSLLFGYKQVWFQPSTIPLSQLDFSVDFTALTPLQLNDQLSSDAASFDKVRTAIIGGQKTSETLVDQLQGMSTRFVSTYGMTETTSHIALRELNQPRQEFFNALGNTSVRLDERGCLVIDSPHLGIQGLVTNDLAELFGNQQFSIRGRADFIINSGGAKVNPEVVEEKIGALINSPFFVSSEKDDRLGQRVIIIIEDEVWTDDHQKELLIHLKGVLTSAEFPRSIYFKKKLERTPTGKIIRKWN